MNRIEIIASKVEDNSKVIDIGCDHAYLGIELLKQNRNIKVIASDISKNVISSTKKNIDGKYDIDLRCGGGLDVVDKDEIDTIVIAGMGAHNQMKILASNIEKLVNVKTIILSPNDSAFYIRSNLDKIGYYVYDEDIIYDHEIYYPLIVLKKGKKDYTYLDILLGPILKNSENTNVKNYYGYLIFKKKNILSCLPDKYSDKKSKLLDDIKILEKNK